MISVRDNGEGMTQERIAAVLSGKAGTGEEKKDSTGIGVDNVINRLELFFREKDLLTITSEGPGQGTEGMQSGSRCRSISDKSFNRVRQAPCVVARKLERSD